MAETAKTDFIEKLPKAELHLHLEGSITPGRFLALSGKYGSEQKDWNEEQVSSELFQYADFAEFLDVYKSVCGLLREPPDYQALLLDLEGYLASQNIRYAEVIYTPSIPWKYERDGEAVLEALLKTSAAIEARGRVQLRWILDCVRQFGAEAARRTAELAARFTGRGVTAIGLGGDENSLPMSEYEEVFTWARANSLHIHAHAGEIGEPLQVWEALKLLGANRIGHGIQAARDPQLMDYLRDHAIGLDVCLTSNARTGAWTPGPDNPFWLLHKRGVPVTLNTDDPGLFSTTLNEEYRKASDWFGLDEHDLAYIAMQGIRSSFLPHDEKMQLMQQFQDEIHALLQSETGVAAR